jgi:NAD(P)H-nitrite reductase large subunit
VSQKRIKGGAEGRAPKENLMVCRCNEVTQAEVEEAIAEGFISLDEVKRHTRAGMGLCQGRTCGRLVRQLIARKTKADPAGILPGSRRMPVRPVKLAMFQEQEPD